MFCDSLVDMCLNTFRGLCNLYFDLFRFVHFSVDIGNILAGTLDLSVAVSLGEDVKALLMIQ